jgi:hypothetical protein
VDVKVIGCSTRIDAYLPTFLLQIIRVVEIEEVSVAVATPVETLPETSSASSTDTSDEHEATSKKAMRDETPLSEPSVARKRRRTSPRTQSMRAAEANSIVRQLCSLETNPETWKDLQFRIIALFPKARW